MQVITRKQAQEQGLTRYFTGKPCKHGHIVERLVCDGSCKTCANLKKQRKYQADPGRYIEAQKQRYIKKTEQDPDWIKRRYQANASTLRAKAREYARRQRELDPDFDKRKHAKRDIETVRAQRRRYWKERKASDPGFKLATAVRSYVWKALRNGEAMKAGKYRELLGCETQDLMAHLEAQFADGMTWANHGEWHIDHIRPCASFDLTDPAQQRECFHYTNLQPLWWQDNLSKGAKLVA